MPSGTRAEANTSASHPGVLVAMARRRAATAEPASTISPTPGFRPEKVVLS